MSSQLTSGSRLGAAKVIRPAMLPRHHPSANPEPVGQKTSATVPPPRNGTGTSGVDVSDCQWIQYLHSVGLLRASFRPPAEICAIRSLWRHRESLIQMASQHTQHIQKALDQMNLQIHHVLSKSTGWSRLRILDA